MGLLFDSSSLIIVMEIGMFPYVLQLGVQCAVTRPVVVEVHSVRLKDYIERGELVVVPPVPPSLGLENRLGLGEGEISVLEYALLNRQYWSVLDEKRAREVARRMGLRYIGTARLLKHLADRSLLTRDRLRQALESLPTFGFYIEPGTINEVLDEPELEIS